MNEEFYDAYKKIKTARVSHSMIILSLIFIILLAVLLFLVPFKWGISLIWGISCALIVFLLIIFNYFEKKDSQTLKIEHETLLNTILDYSSNQNIIACHSFQGLPGSLNDECLICEKENGLVICILSEVPREFEIPYSRVVDVKKYSKENIEKEFKYKNGNIIGRAAVGSLLFGDIGALVGALSAQGAKSKTVESKTVEEYLLISMISKEQEERLLSFKIEDSDKLNSRKISRNLECEDAIANFTKEITSKITKRSSKEL
jgi:hypothetical protein